MCVSALFFVSCGDKDTERIIVASGQGDCEGVSPQRCLLVKKVNTNKWEYWYGGIEGFDYEPGYEYVLRVKREKVENPAADQSDVKLILVEQLGKEKKVSDILPGGGTFNDKRIPK